MAQPIWISRQSQTTGRQRHFLPWLISRQNKCSYKDFFAWCRFQPARCRRYHHTSLGLKCVESGLGAGNVLLYRAATHPDTTDYFVAYSDRQPTTEDGDTRDVGHNGEQRRIVLDEVVKVLRGHTEKRSVSLVLCHLDADQRRAVHAAEGLEQPAFVEDRYHLR